MGNTIPPRMLYNDWADAALGAVFTTTNATADPLFPFANVLHRDRHVIGAFLSPPSNCDVDIALGSTREIFGVGFANLYPVSGASLPGVGIEIWAAENAPMTQNPVLVTTIAQSSFFGASSYSAPKTHGVLFTSGYTYRYWRIRLKGWVSFYAGRFMLFGAAYDMPAAGTGFRKGSGFVKVTPRSRGKTLGGNPVIEDIGAASRRFVMRFRGPDEKIRSQAEAIIDQRRPWMHTDHDGIWRHVETTAAGDEQGFDQVGVGYPNVWELTLETEQIAP